MKPHVMLRAATAADHEIVDSAFSAFDLSNPGDYGRFLRAHARALPSIETAVSGMDLPVKLRPRSAMLAADLDMLGATDPGPSPFPAPGDQAEAFGMAYVIEGSRLGGSLIARTLPDGAPASYLSAGHLRGEWRAFLDAFDHAAGDDGTWLDRATASAKQVFRHYAAAAAMEQQG
jgi:heme oxygenase (biliverdin-IX-beta and delta-forming)